jgi:hypothetical protein
MNAWELEQAVGTPAPPAYKDDILARLYDAAEDGEDYELLALNDLAIRAGLLWCCPDKECGWHNLEDADKCDGCGKSKAPVQS